MESANPSSTCQTCLASSLEYPINLFDSSYKDYLDVLQRLLGLQLFVEGGRFTICSQCQGKIIWVSEFKVSCLKSLEQLGNVDHLKTELGENENVDAAIQCISEIKVDGEAAVYSDDSDSDYVVERPVRTRRRLVSKYTRKTRSAGVARKRKSSGRLKPQQLSENDSSSYVDSDSDCPINRVANNKRKRKVNTISDDDDDESSDYEQFPSSQVAKAIADIDKYTTDIASRKCLFCDFTGRNAAVLRVHVKNKHEDVKGWCEHCNLQFEDLQVHGECNKTECTFCEKHFACVKRLIKHLQHHCKKSSRDKPARVLQRGRRKEKVKRLKLQQFPAAEVLRAIADSRSYLNDIKNRQCVICEYVGADAGILQIHIGRKHEYLF